MQKVPSLNGWNYDEVLLVYGLVTLSKSINHMFADNLWTLGRVYIRSGGFDRFLVRPIDPFFHLLADRFCQDGVGNFLVGLALVKSVPPLWVLSGLLQAGNVDRGCDQRRVYLHRADLITCVGRVLDRGFGPGHAPGL